MHSIFLLFTIFVSLLSTVIAEVKPINPANGEQYVSSQQTLKWPARKGAKSYDVYFGTSKSTLVKATTSSSEFKGNHQKNSFPLGRLDFKWKTYYWRIDARAGNKKIKGIVYSFKTSPSPGPEFADRSKFLEHDVLGRKHGFLAGNKVYYLGGRYGHWELRSTNNTNKRLGSEETLGFMNPYFYDGRSQGTGLTKHKLMGDGSSDGWSFHKYVKAAMGSVIINGKRYEYPKPTKRLWRPDKNICEYEIAGVKIVEEKYISDNDVLVSMITSSKPVTLEFDGQSFWFGDAKKGKSLTSTAKVAFEKSDNAVHISEGGTISAQAGDGKNKEQQKVPIMYTGMHTIIASSNKIIGYENTSPYKNVQFYKFKTTCDSKGLTLLWTMDDDYKTGIKRVDIVRDNAAQKKADKTAAMNSILNYQIPYFSCSDKEIESVYYFLFAIHSMYYHDINEGWLSHPHTQTAINNFMGPHRWDYNFQVKVGNWMVNKDYYTFGNYLIWENVPDRISFDAMPEWFGKKWITGPQGPMTEMMIHAYDAYKRTGDLDFLKRVYLKQYKPLANRNKKLLGNLFGAQFEGIRIMQKMAELSGDKIAPDYWQKKLLKNNDIQKEFDGKWESNGHKYWYAGSQGNKLNSVGMTHTRNNYPGYEGDFPDLWAAQIYNIHGMDPVNGFYGDIPPLTARPQEFVGKENTNFATTPDTAYFRLIGSFKNHVGLTAAHLTTKHLKAYNIAWDGVPVAPEMIDIKGARSGDMFSNFNAGKILLILEGLAGIDYSLIDNTFTLRDCMPPEWDYMHVQVPIGDNDRAKWVNVRVDRKKVKGNIIKNYSIKNSPLAKVIVNAFLEERKIADATNKNFTTDNTHFHGYALYKPFKGSDDINFSLKLADTAAPWPNPALFKHSPGISGSTVTMEAEYSVDKDGVQYYFECITDPKFNSSWQDSHIYSAKGLSSKMSYSFRVKTRDKSTGKHQTGFSKPITAVVKPEEAKKKVKKQDDNKPDEKTDKQKKKEEEAERKRKEKEAKKKAKEEEKKKKAKEKKKKK